MAIIIRKGTLPESDERHDFLSRQYTCPHCQCRFRLEPHDKYHKGTTGGHNGRKFMTTNCPYCGHYIWKYLDEPPALAPNKTIRKTIRKPKGKT